MKAKKLIAAGIAASISMLTDRSAIRPGKITVLI